MQTKRPKAKTFRDLLVWRKAHEFVLGVYRFTATFPKSETYGLALQMRRAAVSIPANIAEGFARRSDADKVRFFNIAVGSVEESRYYLILSQDLGYGDTQTLTGSLEEASRLLSGYTRAILAPDSWLPYPACGISRGEAPCLVRCRFTRAGRPCHEKPIFTRHTKTSQSRVWREAFPQPDIDEIRYIHGSPVWTRPSMR